MRRLGSGSGGRTPRSRVGHGILGRSSLEMFSIVVFCMCFKYRSYHSVCKPMTCICREGSVERDTGQEGASLLFYPSCSTPFNSIDSPGTPSISEAAQSLAPPSFLALSENSAGYQIFHTTITINIGTPSSTNR